MTDMSELPRKNEELKPSGYYLKNGMLYSKDPDQIFAKLAKIRSEGGSLDIMFQGDLLKELDECINNPDTETGLKGVKNVISFGLAELYSSINSDNFQEEAKKSDSFKAGIEKIENIVDCLLAKYNKDFFLLFTPEHDSSTIIHSVNVMALALYTHQHVEKNFPNDEFLNIATVEEFALAGLLHDMGKINMEDIIRKTEKLTEEDWQRIKQHPRDGYEILKQAGITSHKVLNATLFHHVRLNGTGYPDLKPGEKVEPLTILISIVDSLEAMISKSRKHNVNRDSMSMKEAANKLHTETTEKHLFRIDFLKIVADALRAHDQEENQTTN